MEQELHLFRKHIKEVITNIVYEKYMELYGRFPDMCKVDEISITEDEIGTFYIPITTYDAHNEIGMEKNEPITAFVLTMNNNLTFVCGEDEIKKDWREINTDALFSLMKKMQNIN